MCSIMSGDRSEYVHGLPLDKDGFIETEVVWSCGDCNRELVMLKYPMTVIRQNLIDRESRKHREEFHGNRRAENQ